MFTTPRGPELFTVGDGVVVFAHVPGLQRSFTPPVLVCRCWALALFGGNSETGFDQNTTYSIFSISITLTDEGFQSFYQVKRSLHLSSPLFCLFGRREKNELQLQKFPLKSVWSLVLFMSLSAGMTRGFVFFFLYKCSSVHRLVFFVVVVVLLFFFSFSHLRAPPPPTGETVTTPKHKI